MAVDKLHLLTRLLNHANDLNANLIAAESSIKSLLILRDQPLIAAALRDVVVHLLRIESAAAAAVGEVDAVLREMEANGENGGSYDPQ
jgi:hypothetical protein